MHHARMRRPLLCTGMVTSASATCLAPTLLFASASLARGFFAPPTGSALPYVSHRRTSLDSRQHGLSSIRTCCFATRSPLLRESRRNSLPSAIEMRLASPEDAVKVVVCGPQAGIAGLVAERLSAAGGARQVVLADESEELSRQLAGAKVVVGSSDGGPDADEAPPGLADEIVTALPSETQYLVWVDSPEAREAGRLAKKDMGFFDGLLGGGFKESLEAVQSVEGSVKCFVVHTGRLFGTAGGEESVPFLTGPKAEPVLDESITRCAVLLGPGTVLSSPEDAATKRSSVAEAIERLLRGPERRSGVDLSVVSVEGFASSDEEWQETMTRLDDSEGAVAVFSIDFDAIEKKEQLVRWLADSWGPTALRKSTAAMLRSGARPVAVSPTPNGLDLVWETLTEDLTAVQAGKLSVTVNDQPAGLRVVRMAGPGQPQGRALSGEEEIVQSLLEGINAVAYPKALARRKAPKPSLVGAAAAGSAGGRAEMEASSSATSAATAGSPAAPATSTAAAEADIQKDDPTATPASPKGRGRRSGGKRRKSP